VIFIIDSGSIFFLVVLLCPYRYPDFNEPKFFQNNVLNNSKNGRLEVHWFKDVDKYFNISALSSVGVMYALFPCLYLYVCKTIWVPVPFSVPCQRPRYLNCVKAQKGWFFIFATLPYRTPRTETRCWQLSVPRDTGCAIQCGQSRSILLFPAHDRSPEPAPFPAYVLVPVLSGSLKKIVFP